MRACRCSCAREEQQVLHDETTRTWESARSYSRRFILPRSSLYSSHTVRCVRRRHQVALWSWDAKAQTCSLTQVLLEKAHRNTIRFNHFGSLVCVAGFGNLAGEIDFFGRLSDDRSDYVKVPCWSLFFSCNSPRLLCCPALEISCFVSQTSCSTTAADKTLENSLP